MKNHNISTVVPEDLVILFKQLFREEYGLSLDDHIFDTFRSILPYRLRKLGLKSVYEYYNFLCDSLASLKEKSDVLDLITVCETYFFRNSPQIEALCNYILPELIQRKLYSNDKKIKIWSAGCSAGDEPYTIALILDDLIPDRDNWDISILGTDINRVALANAAKGIFTKKSVKDIPEKYFNKYFKAQRGKYKLSSDIVDMVTFKRHNLSDTHSVFPEMDDLDILFCRNVTIYFDVDYTKKVIEHFYNLLNSEGVMFIGHSETLYNISDKFVSAEYKNAFVYRKKTSPVREKNKLNKTLTNFEKTRLTSPEKIKRKNTRKLTPTKRERTPEKQSNTSLKIDDKPKSENSMQLALKLLSSGNMEEAALILNDILKSDKLNSEAYCQLGIISLNSGNIKVAENNFRALLYNEPNSPIAHFYLGEVYNREGNYSKAVNEYSNALKLLQQTEPENQIKFSEGFTAGFLIEICKNKLEKIKDR